MGDEAWQEMARHAALRSPGRPVIVLDAYPGADLPDIVAEARRVLPQFTVVDFERAAKTPAALQTLLDHNLTDDRVFGVLSHHSVVDFYDPLRVRWLVDRVGA